VLFRPLRGFLVLLLLDQLCLMIKHESDVSRFFVRFSMVLEPHDNVAGAFAVVQAIPQSLHCAGETRHLLERVNTRVVTTR
jgi:hypothetical protein